MLVTLVCYVFLAVPASDMSTLNAVYLVTPLYFFKRNLTTRAPSKGNLVYFELVKIHVFALFYISLCSGTILSRVGRLATFYTDFLCTGCANCLVLTAAARLLDYCIAINSRTPH